MGIELIESYEIYCDGLGCQETLANQSSEYGQAKGRLLCPKCAADKKKEFSYTIGDYGNSVAIWRSYQEEDEACGFYSFGKAKELAIARLEKIQEDAIKIYESKLKKLKKMKESDVR